MKKYKIYFSIFNLFHETQAQVVRLQQLFKGLTAILTGATWLQTDANHAIYVGIIGYVVDVLLTCLYFEERK